MRQMCLLEAPWIKGVERSVDEVIFLSNPMYSTNCIPMRSVIQAADREGQGGEDSAPDVLAGGALDQGRRAQRGRGHRCHNCQAWRENLRAPLHQVRSAEHAKEVTRRLLQNHKDTPA